MQRDFELVAAAIAEAEALNESMPGDPRGFGASLLRIAVDRIAATAGATYPRFDRAGFEAACLPLEAGRRRASILAALNLPAEPAPEPARCECEGPVPIAEGCCGRCGGSIEYLAAIENGDEWYAVGPLEAGAEVDAGQCESCGSFGEDGEPGAGFVLVAPEPASGRWAARCACGRTVPVSYRQHPEVVS